MTYELCLEYGTYPLSRVDAYWGEDQNPPNIHSRRSTALP